MYIIDSALETPDIDYMESEIAKSMAMGVEVRNLEKLLIITRNSQASAARTLSENYGITEPNSPKAVLDYFMSILDEQIASVCCQDGKWTTNKEAMQSLAQLGYTEAIDILTYRKAAKLAQSIESIRKAVRGDGRIHPNVSLTKTNRISYTDPALMNIPKKLVWSIIGPRNPGDMLVSVDIKQQEPWIMMHVMNIAKLKHLAATSDDIYSAVFRDIFGVDCTPIQRSEIKTCWNALTYGAGVPLIVGVCKHCEGKPVYDYFKALPEFKSYTGACYGLAKKGIQERKTYFGTVVRANEYGARLRRSLMDIPIQGTGADILALLIQHFNDTIEEAGLSEVMGLYFSRHDELVIWVAKEYVEEVGKESVFGFLRDTLEHQIDDWEPFKVEVNELLEDSELLQSTMDNLLSTTSGEED